MLDDESPDVVRAAVTREATTEFDRAVLAHRRFVARCELALYPDRLLAVLDQTDAAGWERMAKCCATRGVLLHVDRFREPDSWRLRAAYMREHHDDERTAAKAGGDDHPRVRTALATVRPDVPGLVDDPSHLVRGAVATPPGGCWGAGPTTTTSGCDASQRNESWDSFGERRGTTPVGRGVARVAVVSDLLSIVRH